MYKWNAFVNELGVDPSTSMPVAIGEEVKFVAKMYTTFHYKYYQFIYLSISDICLSQFEIIQQTKNCRNAKGRKIARVFKYEEETGRNRMAANFGAMPSPRGVIARTLVQ